jgi:hypothetical protein
MRAALAFVVSYEGFPWSSYENHGWITIPSMDIITNDRLWWIVFEKDWNEFRRILNVLKNEGQAYVEGKVIVEYCLEPDVPMDVFESSLELCHPFLNQLHLLERCKDPVKVERLLQAGENPNGQSGDEIPLLRAKIQEFCHVHREVGHLDEELFKIYHVILVLLKYGADYRNTHICNENSYRRAYFAPELSILGKFPMMIALCSARHVSRLGVRSELRWVPLDLLRTLYTFL